jgi:hypothetical protein
MESRRHSRNNPLSAFAFGEMFRDDLAGWRASGLSDHRETSGSIDFGRKDESFFAFKKNDGAARPVVLSRLWGVFDGSSWQHEDQQREAEKTWGDPHMGETLTGSPQSIG